MKRHVPRARRAPRWGIGLAAAWALAALAALAASAPKSASAQKYGGELKVAQRENWPSLSIHEESTISTLWVAMGMYNNLVLYDPARPAESADQLIGELAESWAWSKDARTLTFKLRRGVVWHDGRPFTSADVKHTLDLVRGVSSFRLKLNPRKLWYENVQEVATHGDFEVAIALKRPQPGLLGLLAAGSSPIYPAHVDPAELRGRALGTGPFLAKSIKLGEELLVVRNPNYFVKGRPFLDAVRFIVIQSRPARIAALAAGQIDASMPGDNPGNVRDLARSQAPQLVMTAVASGVHANILLNTKKPPFDNLKVRQAVNLAMDRPSVAKSVYQGGLVPGGANLPPPYGDWGLPSEELGSLPGWGDPAANKAEARKLLAAAGFGPSHPLRVVVSTRALDVYVDVATWVIDQLKQVGIESTLEQFESGVWNPKMARRDYQIATNLTGVGAEDPDANYSENYLCSSQRNYTDYCSKDVEELILRQSQETQRGRRLELVREIDRRLQQEGARPILGHILDYYLAWPRVKGYVPHHSLYSNSRLQDVWLDK
jgi:peptide/nickel transport system substrate-binding protein